ncbi:MAG: SMP-30/gluconolactonase/LRE family protein [Roseibacillus sp.]|jgi:sugar lactone lactonase YvrE
MKTHLFLIAIASATLAAALPATAQGQLKVAWELTEGIRAPESAYFDQKSGYLFLSQIGGGGGKAKDSDGWISMLTTDGKVVKDKWFSGLHAPKGMRSSNGILWVSDIDRLVGINISNGKTHRVYNIPGAKFLNDVAAGPTGIIYVSDMATSTIYQLRGATISKLASGQKLDSPNGLLVSGTTLFIAGWGKELNDSFEAITPGRLLAFNLRSGEIKAITRVPTGNLDGVELDGRGGYFVTDWSAGTVFHITSKGAVTSILDLPKGTADLAYLPKKKLLILPRMMENTVTAYDLTNFKP